MTGPTSLETKADLDAFIGDNEHALVEFYTDGCGICKQMEPVLGIVNRQIETPVGTINPRNDPTLIADYAIQSVPTLIVFVNGQPVARRAEGFIGADDILSWVKESIDIKS